ncbi:MAG: hypothetical protein WDM71_09370 [Ferruginibacter sp.]
MLFTVNGIEGIFDMFFTKHFSGFFNFTCQDADGQNLVTNTSGAVPGVADFKGNVGVTVHTNEILLP